MILKIRTCLIYLIIILSFSSCIPLRSIFYGKPDKKDLDRFPYTSIKAGTDCFEFHETDGKLGGQLKVNDWSSDIPFFVNLDEILGGHAVRSFLVIRKDSILYRYIGEASNVNDLHPSYSIAKSFTSTLIGIAIDDKKINSTEDLLANYLPDLKDEIKDKSPFTEAAFQKLKIKHLLNHTSGIKYKLSMDGQLYYGKDILKGVKQIEFAHEPGVKQHYLNINVQLLGLILEKATGQSVSTYLQEKLWKPLGMCSDAKWTVDNKGIERTFCCMGASAEDYAKLGRLYLQQGSWDGKEIFSEDWYRQSVARDSSDGSSFNYNYCWHIGLDAYGDYMANGLYKQHIYIQPEKEIIIVALCNKEKALLADRVNWWFVFRQIVDQL